MKAAIVGASGVLGKNLIPQFQNAGYSVLALARNPKKIKDLIGSGSKAIANDLLSASVAELVEQLKGAEIVIHAATAIPKDFNAPGAWDLNNRLRLEGTAKLIEASLQAGAGLYLQQSITMAYPDGGDQWLDENTPLVASSSGTAVVEMERRVREIPPARMKWCLLRGGVFVGPGTFQEDLVARLREGKEIVPGDGSHYVSLVHAADYAGAMVLAARKAFATSVFNITSDPLRYGEYVDNFADRLGVARPHRDPGLPKASSWRCSNQAARTQLEWKPVENIFLN